LNLAHAADLELAYFPQILFMKEVAFKLPEDAHTSNNIAFWALEKEQFDSSFIAIISSDLRMPEKLRGASLPINLLWKQSRAECS
jgi:hypothetical protein